jgi:hypothetical protein
MRLHASEEVVPLIIKMCQENKWQALESGSGEFLEVIDNPLKGIRNANTYTQHVVSSMTRG